MTAMVVGASGGLGRALAEHLAAAGQDVVVVSSDERDVRALASDLHIRHGVRTIPLAVDLGTEGADLGPLERAVAELGGADVLLFPIGWTASGDDGRLDAALAERVVRSNFLSVTAVVSRFLSQLQGRASATIVGFGSVAACRGRGANLVYSASKRALQTYFEGLRHASVGTAVRVQFYVLGYLDTNLAFGRRTLLSRADPDRLASHVVRELGRRGGVMYYPSVWRPLCTAVRLVPWFVFKRLKL